MKEEIWHIIHFDTLDSTNNKAHDYCNKEGQKIVIQAQRQTAGRGRRGRRWLSYDGNLFFSLVFEYDLQKLGQLVIVSTISLRDVIKKLNSQADVKLKWPNDVLLNGAKISGMLLEKGAGDYMIVGIGVNIKQSPQSGEILYPTTSLQKEHIEITSEKFLQLFLDNFSYNLQKLQQDGFAFFKQIWLQNAKNLGKMITVRQEDTEETGVFTGIDDEANLLLKQGSTIKKIFAGDVFYIEK